MSQRYKGGVISATPPTTSTSSASGVWTEQQFMQGVASGNWPALAGAPTIGTATAGSLSASVTFTAPTYVGSGITGYTVTSNPSGITGTGASSPVTVSGLTAGTPYTFTVTATTAAGQGSASAASNSVTPTPPNYIEDVYSTYLYTGNGSTQTITNGIDLSTKGGLVWVKNRTGADNHILTDSARGTAFFLRSNLSNAQDTNSPSLISALNSNGFSLGVGYTDVNASANNYVSWTFCKQPKFFDVVTWTGNDAASRQIAHNLGSTPGCVIVKATNNTLDWFVSHRSLATANAYLNLNTTSASATGSNWGNSGGTRPTSTDFTVGDNTNISGYTYVAYLFAHDAGGFGLTGTDNVISCGSFTTDGSGNATVNLGYEPQYILMKKTSGVQNWVCYDTMRGWAQAQQAQLYPNVTQAEDMYTGSPYFFPTATGFSLSGTFGLGNNDTFIYIAIRRGPMKVPTSGTSVFTPATRTGTSATANITSAGFPVDLALIGRRNTDGLVTSWDRLRGAPQRLITSANSAESSSATGLTGFDSMTGFSLGNNNTVNDSTYNYVDWDFRRAPSFFDEVCFTASGSVPLAHNLGVTPELVIYKTRGSADSWWTCANVNGVGQINNTGAWALTGLGNGLTAVAQATSTTISNVNGVLLSPGDIVVAYLFATCAGVSKVGSYTGTGALLTLDCGFAAGARFVLIKRTDSTGDWYTYDSARGITSGNDPYLFLNSTAAEVTGTNYVDTTGVGFQVTAAAPAGLNANGGTYIFLAIA